MRDRLYRSRTDRMLFGVAGGMARYFDLDASVVRIIWALLVLAGGAGLLLYLVAAIVIPEEPLGWVPTAGVGDPPSAPGATTAPDGTAAAPGVTAPSGPPWGYQAGVHRRDRGGGAVVLGIIALDLVATIATLAIGATWLRR